MVKEGSENGRATIIAVYSPMSLKPRCVVETSYIAKTHKLS